MNLYVLVLRLIHILGGVFWGGTALFSTWFLARAVAASGPDGGKVMGKLMTETPFRAFIGAAGGLTVLSGILLYLRDVGQFGTAWISTGWGLGLLIGGLAGLIGLGVGSTISGLSAKIGALGAELQAAGGPPPPEKLQQMAALQATLARNSNINAIMLTIAIILMSLARYLAF